jgi:acyl carrier protein
MTRQKISETVCKYLARALDIDPVGIDTSQSMVDLGANSLDIVEVVSSTMRELRIKIPRENLQNIPNVDGLVDVLLEHAA